MTTLVAADLVTEDIEQTINEGLHVLKEERDARIDAWYHDAPVWVLVSQTSPDVAAVLQVAVVLDRGRLFVELTLYARRLTDTHLELPTSAAWIKIPVGEFTAEELVKFFFFHEELSSPAPTDISSCQLSPFIREP